MKSIEETIVAAGDRQAWELIAAERAKQQKSFCAERDDNSHPDGELAMAACTYATCCVSHQVCDSADFWPWVKSSFHPVNHLENCVKAAALLHAEIARLVRAEDKRARDVVPAEGALLAALQRRLTEKEDGKGQELRRFEEAVVACKPLFDILDECLKSPVQEFLPPEVRIESGKPPAGTMANPVWWVKIGGHGICVRLSAPGLVVFLDGQAHALKTVSLSDINSDGVPWLTERLTTIILRYAKH